MGRAATDFDFPDDLMVSPEWQATVDGLKKAGFNTQEILAVLIDDRSMTREPASTIVRH